MKRIQKLLIILLLFLCSPFYIHADTSDNKVDLYLFHSETCGHCQAEIEFLEKLKDKYSNLEIHLYESIYDTSNKELMHKVKKAMKIDSSLVPFTVIGTNGYIGFNDNTPSLIENSIKRFSNEQTIDVIDSVINGKDLSNVRFNDEEITEVTLPFLGKIDPKTVSLPLISIVIGAVDGFNPCAMWVLIFLITMLFNMKDRKKMWILGLTFLITSALVYLIFMMAWLKIATDFIAIKWVQLLVAAVALIGAFVNIRSYIKGLKKDDGCEVVNDTKRKRMLTRIKKITGEKKFILALLGVILLAFSVNLIELACSAGLPLIFTQILAINNLDSFQYCIYILLYILFFLIDDIIIFVIAMLTLNINAISTKYTKYSHLIGGIIMLLIGILMIFKPEWLMFNFK